MPKVGILGCEATTRDMDCVMIGCFGNLRAGRGRLHVIRKTILRSWSALSVAAGARLLSEPTASGKRSRRSKTTESRPCT